MESCLHANWPAFTCSNLKESCGSPPPPSLSLPLPRTDLCYLWLHLGFKHEFNLRNSEAFFYDKRHFYKAYGTLLTKTPTDFEQYVTAAWLAVYKLVTDLQSFTLMMTSSQVVETSVNTNNSPSQDYTTKPDDHSNHNIDSPGFKPFTVIRPYPSCLQCGLTFYFQISFLAAPYQVLEQCTNAVGMENGEIPDEFISSSSISDNQERAAYGRLNFTPKNGLGGAWSALRNDMNQWLQVQFHDIEIVSKVATQGRQNAKQFVREYYLSYSLLGDLFKHYNKKEVTGKWKPYITSYFQQGKIKLFPQSTGLSSTKRKS